MRHLPSRRRPFAARAYARLAFLSLLGLALPSCIDLDAKLTLSADSSVRLRAAYSISTLVAPLFSPSLGFFEAKPPQSRKELEDALAKVPGAKLASYAESFDSIRRSYDCSIDFPNPDALCAFLDSILGSASYAVANGRKRLSLEIPCPPGRADAELQSRLEVLFGEYSIRLEASLPSAVASAPSGKIDGKTAVFEIKVVDLVKSGKNAAWVLSW
jgi:hypothetical protein